MSTGADCQFVERKPGEWHYAIQRWPYGETPDYDTFGPFRTIKAAEEHLDSNHANPGGWAITRHPDHVHNGRVEDVYGEKWWTCCDTPAEEVKT